jgi:hypothetical protein
MINLTIKNLRFGINPDNVKGIEDFVLSLNDYFKAIKVIYTSPNGKIQVLKDRFKK